MLRRFFLRFFLTLFVSLIPFQKGVETRSSQADKSWFLSWIEKKLSTQNQTVSLSNLNGLFTSSVLSIDRITLADREGVWLKMDKAELRWNPMALFVGHLTIHSFYAERVEILRKPCTPESNPSLKVNGLIPILPFAVALKFNFKNLFLDKPIYGMASVFSFNGDLSLSQKKIFARFNLRRIDGLRDQGGLILADMTSQLKKLIPSFSKSQNCCSLNFDKIENKETMPREKVIKGSLILQAEDEGWIFHFLLGGDLFGFMPEFPLGQLMRLETHGLFKLNGGIRFEQFLLEGDFFRIFGKAETASDGFVRQLSLNSYFFSRKGRLLILPIGSERIAAKSVFFDLNYGLPGTNFWRGNFLIRDIVMQDCPVGDLSLDMGGLVENLDNPVRRHVTFFIKGKSDRIIVSSPCIDINVNMDWRSGGPFYIKNMKILIGPTDLSMRGEVKDFIFQGDVSAHIRNLSIFSGFTRFPISGEASLIANGRIGLISGIFNLDINGKIMNLSTGFLVPDLFFNTDVLFRGNLIRNLAGEMQASFLKLYTKEARLIVNGNLSGTRQNIDFGFTIMNLHLIDSRINGPLVLNGVIHGQNGLLAIGLRGLFTRGLWKGRQLRNAVLLFDGVLDTVVPSVSGTASLKGLFSQENITVITSFRAAENKILFGKMDLVIGRTKFCFNLTEEKGGFLNGNLHLNAEDLSMLSAVFLMEGKGAAEADIILTPRLGRQEASVNARVHGFEVSKIKIGTLRLEALLSDVLGMIRVNGFMNASKISVAGYQIQSIRISSALQNQSSHFIGKVDFFGDLSMKLVGRFLPFKDKGWKIFFDKVNLGHHSVDQTVKVQHSSNVVFQKNGRVYLSNFSMNVGNGSLVIGGVLSLDQADLLLNMKEVPLSFLKLIHTEFDLDGFVNGTTKIKGLYSNPFINFELLVRNVTTFRKSKIYLPDASLSGRIENQVFKLNARLDKDTLNATAEGYLSIKEKRCDLQIKLQNMSLSVVNIFLKDQNLSGMMTASVSLSGRLNNPLIVFSAKGEHIMAKVLARTGVSPLHLSSAGFYKDGILKLDEFNLEGLKALKVKASGHVLKTGYGDDFRIKASIPLIVLNNLLVRRGELSGLVRLSTTVVGDFQNPLFDGSVSIENGKFIEHELNLRFEKISVVGKLKGEKLMIDHALAFSANGGLLRLSGYVSSNLLQGFPSRMILILKHADYNNGNLLSLTLDGKLLLEGPLFREPLISGEIFVQKAEISVPHGFTHRYFLDIKHRHLVPFIAKTLDRAGLTFSQAIVPTQIVSPKLNLQIQVPRKLFVRGNGLDVELGGKLHLIGSLDNIRPIGGFNLIRGHFDILAQHIDFQEGHIVVAGEMKPYLDLIALADADDISVTIKVNGTLEDMKITFISQPELPQDELLARLLFKHPLEELSPFQIAQLVDALAELTGIMKNSVFNRMRLRTGLDTLDLIKDAAGNTGIEAGRYIENNFYLGGTAFEGVSRGIIHLDINPHLKLKGSIGSDAHSNVGVFYERDY
ncbi:MAG: translocation and assembly module TamB [Candidatus Tokpelaia sp. JSC161]|jgi:translocation and assembly module TamB|nr:MAG: translocation and assembly module TamB [Candidatus Tokpelaia sp. JSC161]